jgi:hypothetical protein
MQLRNNWSSQAAAQAPKSPLICPGRLIKGRWGHSMLGKLCLPACLLARPCQQAMHRQSLGARQAENTRPREGTHQLPHQTSGRLALMAFGLNPTSGAHSPKNLEEV